jgi:hypothetical protein
MSESDSFKFKWWDDREVVVDIVRRWLPSDCNTEKDYDVKGG